MPTYILLSNLTAQGVQTLTALTIDEFLAALD